MLRTVKYIVDIVFCIYSSELIIIVTFVRAFVFRLAYCFILLNSSGASLK